MLLIFLLHLFVYCILLLTPVTLTYVYYEIQKDMDKIELSIPLRALKPILLFYYPSIFRRSSSGVVIGLRPNFSTITARTVLEKKAGMVGPM